MRFKIESNLTLECLCAKSIAILSKLLELELSIEVNKSDKKLRCDIETSYAYLKEIAMITNISSSKGCIIKQEIYSQMMVYNIIQSISNDLEK